MSQTTVRARYQVIARVAAGGMGEVFRARDPVTGEVVAVNSAAEEDPATVNSDPYGEGWLFKIRTDGDNPDLLDAPAYSKLIEEDA